MTAPRLDPSRLSIQQARAALTPAEIAAAAPLLDERRGFRQLLDAVCGPRGWTGDDRTTAARALRSLARDPVRPLFAPPPCDADALEVDIRPISSVRSELVERRGGVVVRVLGTRMSPRAWDFGDVDPAERDRRAALVRDLEARAADDDDDDDELAIAVGSLLAPALPGAPTRRVPS